MTVSTRYRHTGLVLVRATTDPGDLDPPTQLNLSDPAAIEQEGRAWLVKVWARSEVREALRLASPALGARIDQLLDEGAGPHSVKELRRAVISVASYLLRWQRRPTPFGMFAGVGTAAIGPAMADVGAAHRAVVRADAEWLTTLIDQLERHPDLRPRLRVVPDSAAIVRDGRVIVAKRAEVGASTSGPPREASVRLTRPVQFALAAAGSPIRFDALAAQLTARFSSAAPGKIHALLHGLVDEGFLITSLRPPMTTVDALTHLVRALHAAGGEDLADIVVLLHELEDISARLARHNSARDLEQVAEIRKAVVAQMSALVPGTGHALVADVRLDARIAIPEPVLAEAALAASVLLRVTTQPFGSATFLDYHARFRTRYGPGALVPVRELVADSGLGYPSGYLGAPRARPAWRMLTERDAALLALIQRATLDGAGEIELTDTDIEALTLGEHADIVVPQRVELGVAVCAASTEAIDRGDFELRVTATPRTPTSMAGRFAHLLDDADRSRLAATYTTEPGVSARDEVVAVQLSFPPRRPHNENVVRVPPLLPDVVSLSEHPDPAHSDSGVIGVDDLAVTADADQMYLVQRSTGRRVIPRIPHALDTTVQSPPLARFLAEVADARSAVFRGFDLGAARTLPYVPRIRYRRTVLAATRWILTSTDLPGRPGGESAAEALRSWRQRWRVPARVVLCHGELRLPLDLDQDLDRALLRARVQRAGRIELQEDGPPGGQGWIGRPAELLIPMTAITPPARPLPVTAAPGAVLRPGDSAVVHAQLVGNPARFDEILTAHLPRFVDDLDGLVRLWWVRRHRDMIRPETDQHLAVFLRLTGPEQYGPTAAGLAAFAADLHRRGLPGQLTLTSHPQHPARYGEGPALAAAEQVFATDTEAAIAQIATAQASGVPAQALAGASMAHLAAAFAPDPETGYRALIGCLRQEHGPLDRTLRDHTLALTDPDGGYQAVRALPGGAAGRNGLECPGHRADRLPPRPRAAARSGHRASHPAARASRPCRRRRSDVREGDRPTRPRGRAAPPCPGPPCFGRYPMTPGTDTGVVTLTAEQAASQSLAQGAAGTAFLHIERAWTGSGSWETAQSHIRRAAAGPVDAAEHAGLYYGAPAIAFMLHAASDRHPRYHAGAEVLNEHVLRLTRRRLVTAAGRIESGEPAAFAEFDLFSGLTGIGALLVRRSPGSDVLAGILRYVVGLTEPRRQDGVQLPGWWVAHDPDAILPTPGGHANFGMAHGAAGLLALLALATTHGCVVDGQKEAIAFLTGWFDRWRQDCADGPWWPQWITRDELRTGHPAQPEPGRPSWCYGTVGIARAQQLAAIATHDPGRREAAEDALAACLTDKHLDRITEPGLCHGMAGVYQTAYRAARDARNPAIGRRLPVVAARLAQHADSLGDQGIEGGLLTGGAGLALALETTRRTAPPRTGWDACLLIT